MRDVRDLLDKTTNSSPIPGAVSFGLLAVLAYDFAAVFRLAAQYWRILSAAAFLCAAVNRRRFLFAGAWRAAEGVARASGFLGGRPRRLVGPCKASMAEFRRSLSATRRAMICSVCIEGIVT